MPDFFLVGASRAGTTFLYQSLIRHPSIVIPFKEPSFFSDLDHPAFPTLESYLALYEGMGEEVRVGDASTAYLPSRGAADRIHALAPRARIIAVLRNPVDRAYSLYWYKVGTFTETLPFEAALDAEDERVAAGWPFGNRYVTTGRYAEQVLRFRDAFGPEQVRIYLFEDLVRDAGALVRSLCVFLDVDPALASTVQPGVNFGGPPRSRILGRLLKGAFPGRQRLTRLLPRRLKALRYRMRDINTARPPAMSAATRARLVEVFRPDVERLEEILGRDLSAWLAAPPGGR